MYGSRARRDAEPASDLDVLVEFDAGRDPDLFEMGSLQPDLTDAAGIEVDLKTQDMFSAQALTRVQRSAVIAYAE